VNRSQRFVTLTRLASELRSRGSWCGETHIQKATYLLQELTHADTEFEFILYKHGPFSFELRDEINEMIASGLFELEQHYPYGPSLVPTKEAEGLETRFEKTVLTNAQSIQLVADFIGDADVVELERLATALYVIRQNPHASIQDVGNQLSVLKPHIDVHSAVDAAEAVRKLDDLASTRGVASAR
jgi:hypothetical protein